jgi:hypothetical protein
VEKAHDDVSVDVELEEEDDEALDDEVVDDEDVVSCGRQCDFRHVRLDPI